MNDFNFKWRVTIPATCFMAGIHRFKTKKEAQEFINKWNGTKGNQLPTYADVLTPEKIASPYWGKD